MKKGWRIVLAILGCIAGLALWGVFVWVINLEPPRLYLVPGMLLGVLWGLMLAVGAICLVLGGPGSKND